MSSVRSGDGCTYLTKQWDIAAGSSIIGGRPRTARLCKTSCGAENRSSVNLSWCTHGHYQKWNSLATILKTSSSSTFTDISTRTSYSHSSCRTTPPPPPPPPQLLPHQPSMHQCIPTELYHTYIHTFVNGDSIARQWSRASAFSEGSIMTWYQWNNLLTFYLNVNIE